MLIEKADSLFGGTSTTSGGGFWTPMNKWQADVNVTDSREAAIAYITGCGGGRTDQATVEAYVDTAHVMMEWLSDTIGVEFAVGGAHDYYDNVEGFLNYGRNSKVKSGKAGDVWNAIQAKLQERGCEILMGTALDEFYTDANGSVIGVKALQGGKEVNIKAGAVLMGTGGFDHDPEMTRENLPAPIFYSNAAQTNTGDGHRAAGRINAKLGLMSFVWAMPNIFPGKPADFDPAASVQFDIKGNDFNRYRGYPNSMIVNSRGHRFGDESATYPVYNMSMQNFSSDTLTYENVPAFFICDSTYVETYELPGMGEGDASWFEQADTIEELAEKLGIDAAGLVAEVAKFNGYAQTGVDEDYHRGEKESSKSAWLKKHRPARPRQPDDRPRGEGPVLRSGVPARHDRYRRRREDQRERPGRQQRRRGYPGLVRMRQLHGVHRRRRLPWRRRHAVPWGDDGLHRRSSRAGHLVTARASFMCGGGQAGHRPCRRRTLAMRPTAIGGCPHVVLPSVRLAPLARQPPPGDTGARSFVAIATKETEADGFP